MPNYNIPTNVAADLKVAAAAMIENDVVAASDGFPLSAERIQELIMPPNVLDAFRVLETADAYDVDRRDEIYTVINGKSMPDLNRDIVLRFWARKSTWFALRRTYMSPGSYNFFDKTYDRLDAARATDNERAALAVWVARVFRARRLQELANKRVADVLDTFKKTQELSAVWPFLPTLCNKREWKNRFAEVPARRLVKSAQVDAYRTTHADSITVADAMIIRGQVLAEAVKEQRSTPRGGFTAELWAWTARK